MSIRIGIIGTGGFAREVAALVARQLGESAVAFVPKDAASGHLNGLPLSNLADLPREAELILAIADGAVRRRLADELASDGWRFATVSASTAVRLGPTEIGEGTILCDFAMVTANARIGRHFQANWHAYVAHDCVVGDFVTLGPRASVNGAVVLEDGVYVGAGALIRQGTPERPVVIGKGAVIGMGAVVLNDVPPGATVVGNPARPLVC